MKIHYATPHRTVGPEGSVVYGIAVWAAANPNENFCGSYEEYDFRVTFREAGFYGGTFRVYTLPSGAYTVFDVQRWADRWEIECIRADEVDVMGRPDTKGWDAVPIRSMKTPGGYRYGQIDLDDREDMPMVRAEKSGPVPVTPPLGVRVVDYVKEDDIALLRESQDRPVEPPL